MLKSKQAENTYLSSSRCDGNIIVVDRRKGTVILLWKPQYLLVSPSSPLLPYRPTELGSLNNPFVRFTSANSDRASGCENRFVVDRDLDRLALRQYLNLLHPLPCT